MSTAMGVGRLLILSLIASLPSTAFAIDVGRDDVRAFIDRMVEDHAFDRDYVTNAISNAESMPKILEAISRPAEKTLTWPEYRNIFLKPERIEAGAAFWAEHADEIQRISRETGVSANILLGIIGVETYFGRITGGYRVLDALATLAFDYPPRSAFFTRELEQFLLLVREEGIDATAPTGSYAGAMGRPQFMPSSYRAYAVDATDDGHRDIWNNWSDVLGSVANYFVEHGWQPDGEIASPATLPEDWSGDVPPNRLEASETVGAIAAQNIDFDTEMPADHPARLVTFDLGDGEDYWVGFHNFFVITRYNRNVMYALAVYQLGEEIALEVSRSDS
jgi:membrane-bound lytic murein transglycosylase B